MACHKSKLSQDHTAKRTADIPILGFTGFLFHGAQQVLGYAQAAQLRPSTKIWESVMMAGVESKTDNKHLETSCLKIYQLDLAVNLGKSIHPLRFSVKLTFYSISLLVIFLYEPLTTRKWWTRLTVFIFYHDADCTTFPSIGFFQHISRRPSCTAQCTKMHLF